MPVYSFHLAMVKGLSLLTASTGTPSASTALRAASWHSHASSALPEKAAGKKASTTFLPRSADSVWFTNPAPARVKSGAAWPSTTAARAARGAFRPPARRPAAGRRRRRARDT